MCVNNLSKVALDLQSQVQRPKHYATEPERFATHLGCINAIRGGLRGGQSRLRPPFGTEAVTHGRVS